MSESSSSTAKPVASGVQGLAMMAPVIGLPLGLHAVSGALIVGAGIAPIALPAAVPLLVTFAMNGELSNIAGKLFASARSANEKKQVIPVPVRVTNKAATPPSTIDTETDI